MKLTKEELDFILNLSDNEEESNKLAGEVVRALYSRFYNLDSANISKLAEIAVKALISSIDEQKEKQERIKERNKANGAKGGRPRKESTTPKVQKPTYPSWDEFREYALTKADNISNEALKLKYDAWVENNWKDGKDKKIKNWKTKLLNTIPYLKNEKQRRTATYDIATEQRVAETLFGTGG